jgi:hypothetical protein
MIFALAANGGSPPLVPIDANGPLLPLVQNASHGGSQPKADITLRHIGREAEVRCDAARDC